MVLSYELSCEGGSFSSRLNPIDFHSEQSWSFIFLLWNPGLCGLFCSPVVPPSLSAHKYGTNCSVSSCLAWSTSCCLAHRGPPATMLPWVLTTQAAHLCPSISLDECFFFNSLVVELLYCSTFWQFWLFFVFKFVVLLLVVWGGKVYLPTTPS